MKQTTLSLPGKTFLAGEYLALVGGPSFILCTQPRFELQVSLKENIDWAEAIPFHIASPAGKLFEKHREFFSRFHFEFRDPYKGIGGFGASSAQFGLLHAVLQMGEEIFGDSVPDFDWHKTLTEYRELGRVDVKGLPPSGADIVGVMLGGIAFFDRNLGHAQRFAWPFPELKFTLFHTGEKLATHEHLKTLKIFETDKFQAAILRIIKGLNLVLKDTFVQGLREYRDELGRQKRITDKSLQAIAQFEKIPHVLVAKGCGAMGSDVLLVLHQEIVEDGKTSEVLELGHRLGFRFIATEQNVTGGLLIENDFQKSSEPLKNCEAQT